MLPYRALEIEGLEEIQQTVLGYLQDLPRVFRRETGANLNRLVHSELLTACPRVVDVLAPYGLKCTASYAFVMYSQASCAIHSDAIPHKVRLNVPILNCEGTWTRFYECAQHRKAPHVSGKATDVYFDCTEIAAVQVIQPTLLRVDLPHMVQLSEKVPRITLSLAFDKDPVFLLE